MNQVHRKSQPPTVGSVEYIQYHLRQMEAFLDPQAASFKKKEWKIREKKLIRSEGWSQIESQNGAAPTPPEPHLGPHSHVSSPFSKLGNFRSSPHGTHLHHFSPGQLSVSIAYN